LEFRRNLGEEDVKEWERLMTPLENVEVNKEDKVI
jgi:hypothetical protein